MTEPLISNLKNCPFCSSHEISKFTLSAEQSPTGAEVHTRNCQGCGASTGGYTTPEDADGAWNQRVGAN